MTEPLGLSTRICPTCRMRVAHRTLYARTETKGRTRWLRLFWACTGCNGLNHVIVPAYRFQRIVAPLPAQLSVCVAEALRERRLDFDELIMTLRRGCPGVRHVFNSDVMMVLEYLVKRGIVAEEKEDVTDRSLAELRARTSDSKHLGLCPDETYHVSRRSLVSIYYQHRSVTSTRNRFAPAGVYCLRCGFHRLALPLARARDP